VTMPFENIALHHVSPASEDRETGLTEACSGYTLWGSDI
jgi:hypothetical protein